MKAYTELPEGKCECPVCNGTGRVPAGNRPYKNVMAGYDKVSDTFGCSNCGAQYMFSTAKGYVVPNKDGVGCTHKYSGQNAGRCLTTYTCEHCGDRYQIDSGD
jgi:rubredoxin